MPSMLQAVEAVRYLEVELTERKKEVSRALRIERVMRKLTLKQVGKKVRLSGVAVHNIEKAKSWKTKTVTKLAKYYDSLAA